MRASVMTRHMMATAALTVSLVSGSNALVVCGDSNSTVPTKKVDAESMVFNDDIAASGSLVDSSEAVVVSSAGPTEQRRVVGIAVAVGLPILVADSTEGAEGDTTAKSPKRDARGRDTGADIADMEEEIDRLDAKTVLTMGVIDLAGREGRQIIADLDMVDDLKELVGTESKVLKEAKPKSTRAAARVSPEKPTVVESDTTKDEAASQETQDRASNGQDNKEQESVALPKGSSKEVGNKLVLAASGTGSTSIATARAADLKVSWLPVGDAHATSEPVSAARDDESLIALGKVFDDKNKFNQSIKLAKSDKVKEPSGGDTLLFPGRYLIVMYGHPGAAPLGVMNEDSPEDTAARAKDYVRQYEKFVGDPVLPAFEIIASVAQTDPGPCGDYSEPAPVEILKPYVGAMTKAGGCVIIDLQPGSADFLDQVKFYEELPGMPDIDLVLDPEWEMEPGRVPATQAGHVEAERVNRVADWLTELTRKNNLSQKVLMLYQFQLQMICDRETLDLSRPELAFALHAGGHGIPQKKFGTWSVILQGLQPRIFETRKNLIDKNQPMLTPEEIMDIEPRPRLVMYRQAIGQQK